MTDLFKFILDSNLKLGNSVRMFRTLNSLTDLQCLFIHISLVETLCMIDLVLDTLRVELRELVIAVGRGLIVLHIVVAIAEEGEGSS